MHAGKLTRDDLATWTLNRYYYQTRIPIKDAIIVSKSEDPAFRPPVDPPHPRSRR
jgi:pyrroloquinoline-quinone synthase